jgi:hypothetical protein
MITIMSKTKTSSTSHRSYRIRVEGSLDPSWSDRLGGLAITSSGQFGVKTTTVLEGELVDQSALMGVLNTLHDLHLPLEAIENLSPDAAEAAHHESAH